MSRVSVSVLDHLVDGVLDVGGGVVGDARLHAARQLLLDGVHLDAHAVDHVERVGVGQGPDAHEHGGLAREADLGVVVLRAEHHLADVLQPHDGAGLLADDEALEILHGAQVGVGGQVDLDERALGAADGGEVVVGGQRLTHLDRADVERGHALGLEPDAHGEGAGAEDVGALHAFDGGKARLDDAHQVVGDLVLLEHVGPEAEIGRGELAVGRLDVDDRHLGVRRQIAADLVDLGADFRERLDGVVVELQARR